MGRVRETLRSVCLRAARLGFALWLLAGPVHGETFTVTTAADSGAGSLRQAILDANASAETINTIDFAASVSGINLATSLPAVEAGDLSIDGTAALNLVVSGVGSHRVFFVESGSLRLTRLKVSNGRATGGAGAGRAGGGLGAGGGLYVAAGAAAELQFVTFESNSAVGGAGGDGTADGGGGGGLVGDGGANAGGGGGGGGFDLSGAAADGSDGDAAAGGGGGGLLGGAGGASGAAGQPGGPLGGGGGAGPGSASAGAGGEYAGGGGATGSGTGGTGGFGGGGGGGSIGGGGGIGGFGAGDGAVVGMGDGGSGFGGAVFVEAGGSLSLLDANLSGNSATAGTGGTPGEVGGEDLYVSDGTVEVQVLSGSQALAGSISGEGGLLKTGAGELVLTGANDYTGTTTVTDGVLAGDHRGLQGTIVNDAQLEFDLADDMGDDTRTFTGTVSGTGGVVKQGAGTLTFANANSYAGGTSVTGGVLRGAAAAIPGDVAVSAGTTLVFDEPGTATHTGSRTGAGSFVKEGAGTLTWSGETSSTGGTTVSAGALRGDTTSLQGSFDIAAGTELIFDFSGTGSFSGTIDGAGEMEKRGGGTLTLPGAQSYTGGTTVSAGRLDLTGSLASDVLTSAGGTFGGTGNVAGTLTVRGTAAPGTSIGTLSVTTLQFDSGSVYEVEFDPVVPGSSDRIDVAGVATLDGGFVSAVPVGPIDPNGPALQYTILSAGSLAGPGFDGTNDAFAFVDTGLSVLGGDLFLDVVPNGKTFSDFDLTPNQAAVAAALDEIDMAGATGDMLFVLGDLHSLSESALFGAYDEIGGEALTALTTARLSNAQQVANAVWRRLAVVGGRVLGGPGTVGLASRGTAAEPLARLLASADPVHALQLAAAAPVDVAAPPGDARRLGAWLDGYGVSGKVDGDANASGSDWWAAGALGGLDFAVGEHVMLGLGAGWARLDVDAEHRSVDAQADVYQGLLYGTWVGERFHANVLGRYAYTDADTSRQLVFGGIDRTARGNFGGHEAGGAVEVGAVAFAPARVEIEPLAALYASWLQRDGFSETGADALNLDVASDSRFSLVSNLGVRVSKHFQIEPDLRLVPEAFAGWAHEFGDRARPLDARISGATTGGAFQVDGATTARDGLHFGAGWRVTRANALSFLLYYDGNWSNDLLSHALTAGVLVRW